MERNQEVANRLQSVAFIGLSGREPRIEVLARARDYFEQSGSRVISLPSADASMQRFTAPPEERVAALAQLVQDPSIGLMLSLRGGYGVSQILPLIDFEALAQAVSQRGLMLCGYSDFTALSLALLAKTGGVSYAGPSAVSFGAEQLDAFTEERFWQAQQGALEPLLFASDAGRLEAKGILWGGNLTMLVSLLGTPYFPNIDGGILFVEDVNEHPYRVERMLLQLFYAGVLSRQKALLLGQFSNYRLTEYDAGYDLPDAIEQLKARRACPIVTGLPFGHVPRQATLPVGMPVELSVERGSARLAFLST
jgi:muramoyltetrapeptide carboxypeptidase